MKKIIIAASFLLGCIFLIAGILFQHIIPAMERDTYPDSYIDIQPTAIPSSPEETTSRTSPETIEPSISTSEAIQETSEADDAQSDEPAIGLQNPYLSYFEQNQDMVAWLQIPGTVIDYPVMWTPGDENYYLNKDFYKKESAAGSLILDTDSCLDPITTNQIIHGHHMKDGSMFASIMKYEAPEYARDHGTMYLYTKDSRITYEFLCAFPSQVYKKTDQVFKFYQFFQANSEEEFLSFYKSIMDLALYPTELSASYGDRFLTLSTCAYHVKNGRFVVIAKEIEAISYQ